MDQPQQRWPAPRVVFWLVAAVLLGWWQGPGYRRAFQPEFFPPGHWLFLPDWFQEWASAQNFLEGEPVYTPQEVTVERYLGLRRDPTDPYFLEVNAHPPGALFLALPLSGLPFADSYRFWNALSLAALAASLALIVRQLAFPVSPCDLLPLLVVLLLCWPLRHQMLHGQLSLVLLLLLTGVWAAAREGHLVWAGVLLGTAITVKRFETVAKFVQTQERYGPKRPEFCAGCRGVLLGMSRHLRQGAQVSESLVFSKESVPVAALNLH